MERASVATDGDSRTAMDGPDLKQSCPLEWVLQDRTEQLRFFLHIAAAMCLSLCLREFKTKRGIIGVKPWCRQALRR
jgi:hypothetical protein